jgi:ABC-type lipoprotein release transport system permease subunit
LHLLILRLLQSGPLHGYAIAQRIHLLSGEELSVEEGSLGAVRDALVAIPYLKALPVSVSAPEPGLVAAIGAALAAVSIMASLLPALRASRAEPITLLRQD